MAQLLSGLKCAMSELLSVQDAYRAMFAFLEAYYERTQSEDVGSLLGDLQLDTQGEPFDPAVSADWIEAVQKALFKG
jgi:hypothetical protein